MCVCISLYVYAALLRTYLNICCTCVCSVALIDVERELLRGWRGNEQVFCEWQQDSHKHTYR